MSFAQKRYPLFFVFIRLWYNYTWVTFNSTVENIIYLNSGVDEVATLYRHGHM